MIALIFLCHCFLDLGHALNSSFSAISSYNIVHTGGLIISTLRLNPGADLKVSLLK